MGGCPGLKSPSSESVSLPPHKQGLRMGTPVFRATQAGLLEQLPSWQQEDAPKAGMAKMLLLDGCGSLPWLRFSSVCAQARCSAKAWHDLPRQSGSHMMFAALFE
jgi:hypothetical protein